MATLAESFLADLEDLSDIEEDEQEQQEGDEDQQVSHLSSLAHGFVFISILKVHQYQLYMSHWLQMQGDEFDNLNYDDLDAVAQLTKTERYNTITAAVQQALEAADSGDGTMAWKRPSEEDPTYK